MSGANFGVPTLDNWPEWANWVAQDSDGLWRWYAERPSMAASWWYGKPWGSPSLERSADIQGIADKLFWKQHLFRICRNDEGYAFKFERVENSDEEHSLLVTGARPQSDATNPAHYQQGEVECIDALKAATVGKSGIEAVCVANAVKYLWRYEEKNGIEDVKKARWYIDRLIKELGEKQ